MATEYKAGQCADKAVPGYEPCPPDVKNRLYGTWGKITGIVYVLSATNGDWVNIFYEGGGHSLLSRVDYVVAEFACRQDWLTDLLAKECISTLAAIVLGEYGSLDLAIPKAADELMSKHQFLPAALSNAISSTGREEVIAALEAALKIYSAGVQ